MIAASYIPLRGRPLCRSLLLCVIGVLRPSIKPLVPLQCAHTKTTPNPTISMCFFFFDCCWVNIPSGATPFLIRHRTIGIWLLNRARCSSSSEFTSLIFEAGFASTCLRLLPFRPRQNPDTPFLRHRWRRRREISASAAGLSFKNPSGAQLGTGQRETWRQSGLSTLGLAIIWRHCK